MVTLSQPNFSSGELTPLAHGRTDLTKYGTGLRGAKNWIIRPHGCLMNRPGMPFVDRTKYSGTQKSRLIPFVFSSSQSYMLEFSAGAIRVFTGGLKASSAASVNATITAVTDGIVGGQIRRTITLSAPPLTPILVGDTITITGVVATGTLQINGSWEVLFSSGTTIRIIGSGDPSGSYTSGGTIGGPIEIANPYTEADLANLQYAQSADVLTVTLNRIQQYELRRTALSPLAFTFLPVTYNDGPFLTQNTNKQIQVYASATTGSVTLTSTSAIFAATHVGGLFRLEQENLGDIKPWEPTKLLATGATNPASVPEIRRNDGKTYKCVAAATAATNTATGSIPPTHDEGVEMDGDGNAIASFASVVGVSWLYLDSGFGIIRITGYTSPTVVTGTVVRNLPSTVVGGFITSFGPFTFSGNGVTKVFGPLTANTSTDPTKYVVTVGGVIQDPATYTVTAAGGNITFIAAPAAGTNNIVVSQVSANNRTSLWTFGAWSDNQGYPATVTYFQDRLFYAGTTGQPQGVWSSKTGQYTMFGTSVPSQDDDALTFFLNARQINAITDLIALESLLAVTSSGVWRITAGQDEVLTPSTVGFKPQNYIGGSLVRSANVGDSAIYAQLSGRKVRDLLFDFQFDKFTGNELSILAEHLFPYGSTIVRLDYAQDPFSLLFAVRNDGAVEVLSYLRDQEVLGWSPWETDGLVEDMCSIPESGITSTYAIVKRVVNGTAVRFIERFANREFADIDDAVFLDASATYDGRNTSAVTMTLTGGSTWNSSELLTLAASSVVGWASFAPEDVLNEIWLYSTYLNADGESVTDHVRLRIIVRSTSTQVTVTPIGTVPVSLQGVATSVWTFAKTVISGLDHLTGESVNILADGKDVDPQTVVAGGVTLAHPGGVVNAGLGYQSDLETLDFNVPGAPTVRSKSKTIPRVNLLLYATLGVKVGPDEDHLDEASQRVDEDYDAPVDPLTGLMLVPVPTTPNKSGRIFLRQDRPLPTTVIAVMPEIEFGE